MELFFSNHIGRLIGFISVHRHDMDNTQRRLQPEFQLLPMEGVFHVRWFCVWVIEEVLLEVRKVPGQYLVIAEHIFELIGDVHLLSFIVINRPECTIALFLVLQHPRQSKFLDEVVHLFIHVRSRPVNRLPELIHGRAGRHLDRAVLGLAVLQGLNVIAAESKALEVGELRGVAEFVDGQVFGILAETIEISRELM
jgi:hypothetical protein